ncbi:MAG: M48 metallopeptidase family protein [Candidatus Binatia bacterium]
MKERADSHGRRLALADPGRLKAEVDGWASVLRVKPRRVQVQRMTRKWASCSARGRICLSRDLLREEAAFRDVVIVHELLHLIVPNHGKLFRSLLRSYLPNWEDAAAGRVASVCSYGHERLDRRPERR